MVIGEGVSGGTLALAPPGNLWLARDGYLAVTAPEVATSTQAEAQDTIIVATGVSCRQQTEHGTGRRALHPRSWSVKPGRRPLPPRPG